MILDPALIRTGAPGFAMGQDNMSALLALPAPPDALVCGGFEISNGALDCCLHNSVRFPQDIAFVGYGDPTAYRWIGQGISTIVISPEQLASQASQMLAVQGHAEQIHINCSATTFVSRGSTDMQVPDHE